MLFGKAFQRCDSTLPSASDKGLKVRSIRANSTANGHVFIVPVHGRSGLRAPVLTQDAITDLIHESAVFDGEIVPEMRFLHTSTSGCTLI